MASSMSVADVAAFAASSLVEFAEVIVIAVATSVPVAGLCIGVPVVRIITACLRGQRTRFNYIRWWLTCAVSLLLLVNLLFLAVGIGALWLQMPPDPAAMSKGTCRVVSAGVDLRSVKLCTVNDTSSSSSSSSSSPTWLPSSPPTWQAPSQASPHPSSRPFATQSSSSPYASPSPPSSPNHPSSAHVSSSSCHSAPPSSPSTASPPFACSSPHSPPVSPPPPNSPSSPPSSPPSLSSSLLSLLPHPLLSVLPLSPSATRCHFTYYWAALIQLDLNVSFHSPSNTWRSMRQQKRLKSQRNQTESVKAGKQDSAASASGGEQKAHWGQESITTIRTTTTLPDPLSLSLPDSKCRPDFNAAWRAKDKYKVASLHKCLYDPRHPHRVHLPPPRSMRQCPPPARQGIFIHLAAGAINKWFFSDESIFQPSSSVGKLYLGLSLGVLLGVACCVGTHVFGRIVVALDCFQPPASSLFVSAIEVSRGLRITLIGRCHTLAAGSDGREQAGRASQIPRASSSRGSNSGSGDGSGGGSSGGSSVLYPQEPSPGSLETIRGFCRPSLVDGPIFSKRHSHRSQELPRAATSELPKTGFSPEELDDLPESILGCFCPSLVDSPFLAKKHLNRSPERSPERFPGRLPSLRRSSSLSHSLSHFLAPRADVEPLSLGQQAEQAPWQQPQSQLFRSQEQEQEVSPDAWQSCSVASRRPAVAEAPAGAQLGDVGGVGSCSVTQDSVAAVQEAEQPPGVPPLSLLSAAPLPPTQQLLPAAAAPSASSAEASSSPPSPSPSPLPSSSGVVTGLLTPLSAEFSGSDASSLRSVASSGPQQRSKVVSPRTRRYPSPTFLLQARAQALCYIAITCAVIGLLGILHDTGLVPFLDPSGSPVFLQGINSLLQHGGLPYASAATFDGSSGVASSSVYRVQPHG
ncbi:hypothetical protein CLOM_g7188 [Closterium sp. NIES-68]|nr:hypothetical protein CLOM_g7188 [Closterium sp. NIES-68]